MVKVGLLIPHQEVEQVGRPPREGVGPRRGAEKEAAYKVILPELILFIGALKDGREGMLDRAASSESIDA